jgi:hypothetical protein
MKIQMETLKRFQIPNKKVGVVKNEIKKGIALAIPKKY